MAESNPICVLWLNVLSSAMEDIKHYLHRKHPNLIERARKEVAIKWIYRAKGTFIQVAASADKTPEEMREMCLAEINRFKGNKGEKQKRRHPRHS